MKFGFTFGSGNSARFDAKNACSLGPSSVRLKLPFLRNPFTLIELLTVISIISILMTLLLPTLRTARESGKATACACNLKQLGVAITMYADSHDGRFPSYKIYANPPELESWWEQVSYCFEDNRMLVCPSLPNYHLGYGVNFRHVICYADGTNPAFNLVKKFNSFKSPSDDMMACDSHNGVSTGGPLEGTQGFSAIYCRHCYPSSSGNFINNAVSSRHRGGPNCLFVDGSVNWYPVSRVLFTGDSSIWTHDNP